MMHSLPAAAADGADDTHDEHNHAAHRDGYSRRDAQRQELGQDPLLCNKQQQQHYKLYVVCIELY